LVAPVVHGFADAIAAGRVEQSVDSFALVAS
jgi:hypothetical protein